MKIFAISDLHLSTAVEKPMDIFGSNWENHFEKISADWQEKISPHDLVLLGGDISWGMNLNEAKSDYDEIAKLNGKKVVLKGNHDYYWTSLTKMKAAFPEFTFLQNNAFRFLPDRQEENQTGVVIAGSRGWVFPSTDTPKEDVKIFERELIRLELSLKEGEKLRKDNDKFIVMLHFPPFDVTFQNSAVTELIAKYHPDAVVYGHLHGKKTRIMPDVVKDGIHYYLTSCDLTGWKVIELAEI